MYNRSLQKYVYIASCKHTDTVNMWFHYFAKFPLKSYKNKTFVRFKRLCVFIEKKYYESTNQKHKQRFQNLLKTFKDTK